MAEANWTPSTPPLGRRCVVLGGVLVPFLGAVAAMLLMWRVGYMGWLYLGLLVGGWIVTGLGVTVGLHRLLTHRAFETPHWLRLFWSILGAMATQGPPLEWCATHRQHHEKSDLAGDPHSPHHHGPGWKGGLRGLLHAHAGWFFTHNVSDETLQRYIPDLLRDRSLVRVCNLYPLWILIGLLIPASIGFLFTGQWMGALLGLLWGGLARIFFVHHITWSINSICHTFGSRGYRSNDNSRNNFLCGILGHGEGWHNNHHAFPTSARHGLQWWQFDLSWLVIRGMQQLRLAWNVQTPSTASLRSKQLSGTD